MTVDYITEIFAAQRSLFEQSTAKYEKENGISLTVFVNNEPRTTLNPMLIKRQEVSVDGVKKLIKLHEERFINLDLMTECDPVKDKFVLRQMAEINTNIEYQLQDIWGFPKDASYHYWYELPHCNCPKMDNADRKGTKLQVITTDCPIHGRL